MSGHPTPADAPVRAWHIEQMAGRMAASAMQELACRPGPQRDRAHAAYARRTDALQRLAEALQRQPAVQP